MSAYGPDGRRLRANDRVVGEQRILLWRAPWDENPVPRELPVLHEDPHLLAVDKPAGLPVHPSARYHKNTVVKVLELLRPDERLFLGHRLDRETSGVLLLTRSPAADRALKKAFAARAAIEKRYVALTWGVPPKRSFRVDLPLRLDERSNTRVKMRATTPGDGLTAGTRFEVLGARERGGRAYALVQCDLETGRQHQIRVHLATVGTPLVGDKLYAFDEGYFTRDADGEGTAEDRERLELPRHALHAARLSLAHPITGERLSIEAPLPPDIARFWADLAPPPAPSA